MEYILSVRQRMLHTRPNCAYLPLEANYVMLCHPWMLYCALLCLPRDQYIRNIVNKASSFRRKESEVTAPDKKKGVL